LPSAFSRKSGFCDPDRQRAHLRETVLALQGAGQAAQEGREESWRSSCGWQHKRSAGSLVASTWKTF
jgi:hypothetical protein